MKTVIILDGHLHSALAAVRSLGAQGYHVVCGSHHRTGLAMYSRFTNQRLTYPSPLSDLIGFRDAVVAASRRCSEPPLIFTFSDATSLALSRARNLFQDVAVLVMPGEENIEVAFDKRRTVALAQDLGIPVPPTDDDCQARHFPVVIKPRHSVSWATGEGVRSEVVIAQSRAEAERAWEHTAKTTGETPFRQEYIPATEYGISVLCDRGRIIAHCVHQRIRSLVPSGGASVVRVTVDAPSGMYEAAEKLMEKLSWHGPAMIEFRVGHHDHVSYLVEINGRFWGSLALAGYAGVDMPLLFAQLAHSQSVQAPDYRRGVYSRYLLGDMAYVLRSHFSGRVLKGFFSYGGRDHFYDVESWHDPLPAVMDVCDKVF